VLLHGGGANAWWWEHLAARLASRFFVAALDFRGHGDSDHPERVEPGAFGRDLDALLAHLGAAGAALVGHSMGGHVALSHVARGNPTRALVAVELAWGASQRSRRRMRLALAARRTHATRELAVARYRLLPPSPHTGEALRARLAERSVRPQGERFGYKFDPRWFGLPQGPRPDPGAVTCPVLLLRGAESELLTREGAAALAAELPRARLVELPRAGHNPHLDQPELFLDLVLPFLAAHA
jgi:pimeloyl-ACP methyl ester carboxylesterase